MSSVLGGILSERYKLQAKIASDIISGVQEENQQYKDMVNMSDEFISAAGFVVLAIILVVPFYFIAESRHNIKKEAFDRGYMVECIGKDGYYWECEK